MIKVANAPCSWGVLEFELVGESADYPRVLDEMQETGYAGTELGDWGFMPTDPDALRKELARHNLALVGAFVPVDLSREEAHEAGEAAALRTAHLLAEVGGAAPFVILSDENGENPVRTLNAGRIRPEHGLDDEQWQTFAAGVERIARAVDEGSGLRTVFHHHGAGFVEMAGEVERLMALTDPELVGLCLDTGHYRFGGGAPLQAIRRYGDRVWHVHFKDIDVSVMEQSQEEGWDYFAAVRHGVFCELGKGDIDFPAIVESLRERNYEGWIVVEQDVLPGMGTPKASAARNRAYLHSIGL